jgi:antitoxin VapB
MKSQATVLQIRDPRAVELAGRLAALHCSTEMKAILLALENEVARMEGQQTLAERIKRIQDRVMSSPATGLEADKAFYDDLSGDL